MAKVTESLAIWGSPRDQMSVAMQYVILHEVISMTSVGSCTVENNDAGAGDEQRVSFFVCKLARLSRSGTARAVIRGERRTLI